MPRQNRVTPFSALIAAPARGTLMGNRGCLHDDHGRIRRPFLGRRWIICLLSFKNRHRAVMSPGRYTELFFLDEATALAAGHRPCAECQRDRFNLFRETWARANPQITSLRRPPATLVDETLHLERTARNDQTRGKCDSLDALPDGTFIADDNRHAYLVFKNRLWLWTPAGYESPEKHSFRFLARILTPASVVRTLEKGYPVGLHPSALREPA
jgi:hypothetical protein